MDLFQDSNAPSLIFKAYIFTGTYKLTYSFTQTDLLIGWQYLEFRYSSNTATSPVTHSFEVGKYISELISFTPFYEFIQKQYKLISWDWTDAI